MAEDFKIALGATLKDDASSEINSKIRTLESQINPVSIQVQLNNQSYQRVQNQIDNIRQQIQALGNIRIDFGGGNNPRGIGSTTTAMQRAFRDVANLYKQIKSMEEKVGKLGMSGLDADNITQYNQQLNALRYTYNLLLDNLNGQNVNLDAVFNTIGQARTEIAQLSSVVDNARTKLATDIKIDIDNEKLESKIRSIEQSFNNLNIVDANVTNNLNELRRLLGTMDDSDNIEYVTANYRQFNQVLETVTNQIKELQRQQNQTNANNKLVQDRNVLSAKMSVWLKENSAAANQFGNRIRQLQQELQSCDSVRLNAIKKEFTEIDLAAKLAGKNVKTFGDRLKDSFSKLSTYFSAYEIISMSSQAIRSMYDNVIEVDTAMTNLYKVTDETAGRYEQFLTSASKSSQELGRSLSGFIEQTANWAKMGFDIDKSEELAKLSSIYANVADLDDATAVSDLVTVIKAYGIEASNAITIVDSLNKISNEFAVTAAGLGEGLTKAAASMAASGTDFEKTIAMLTGIAEITQSPEEAGNFLKVATMRIQGMKGKLEELGEEVDDSVDSISKVQTQILNLTHGKVNIFDDAGEFRDYYEIMEDISKVVDDLTSTDRASLYEVLFGKQRANQGAALIKAFQSGQVNKAYEAALKSEGSAYAEQAKWAESLEAKLGALQSAWQSLSQTFLDSDFLSGLIEAGTSFINVLDGIINKAGVLPTIFTALSGGMSLFKNKGAFSTESGNIKFLDADLTNLASNYKKATNACNVYNANLNKSIGLQNAYIQAVNGQNSSLGKYLSGLNGAKATMGGYIKSLISAKAGTIGLQVATAALNMALTMGLSLAIQYVVSGLDNLIHLAERASEKADELKESSMEEAKAAQEEAKQLDKLIAKYKELAQSETQDASTRKEIKDVQSDIVDLVGDQAANLDLVNGKLDEEYAKLLKIREEEAKRTVETATSAYHNAIDSSDKAVGSATGSLEHPSIGGTFDYIGARDKKAEKILKEADKANNVRLQTGGYFDNTLYINAYGKDAEENVEILQSMIDALKNAEDYDYASSNLYNTLVKQRDEYQKYVDDVSSSAQTLLDSTIIAETYNEKLTKMNVDSAESFGDYRDKLIDIVKNSPDLSEAIANGDITESEIESNVTSYLATLEHFSDEYNAWYNNIGSDVAKGIQKIKDAYADSDRIKALDPTEAEKQINEFNAWINGLSQKDKEIVYNISLNNSDEARENMLSQLENLSKDGNVDLTVRPIVDSQELIKAGWKEAGEGAATVFTSTFSNKAAELGEDGGIAMNFTPILVDENGNHIGTLSPDELSAYANDVINGVREDDLGLKIGATYYGADAIKQAVSDAEKIHELHEQYLLTPSLDEWNLQNWIDALFNYKADIPKDKKFSFEDLFVDDSDVGFKAQVDAYIEKIETLKEALDSIKSGEFTTKDRYDIESLFPQLVGSDNLQQSIADLVDELTGYNKVVDATGKVTKEASGIIAVFEDAFGRVDSEEDRRQLEAFMKTVLELGEVVGSTAFSIDIDVEADNMKNLYDAINESVSGKGLSTESIKNIENMYSGLEGYDPSKLFELTEHGIHMNVQELRKLQSQYESLTKKDIKDELQKLKQEYNNAKKELAGLTKGTDEYNQKLLEIEGIENQIMDVQRLMAQYEGLTSAYNKWIEAQSTGDEHDMYMNLSDSIESAKKLYEEGWIGTDDFRSWVQMMTDEDLSTASVEKILDVYAKGMPAMERFFTGNTNGLLNFLNDAKTVSEALGEEFVTLDKNGKWHIDFEGIGDAEFAKVFSQMTGLQISAEQLQIILRALSAAGFDVNLESAYASVEELQSKVEETEATVKKLGAEPVDIDIYCSVENAEAELEKAKAKIAEIKNADIDVQVKQAMLDDAYAKVDALIARINQPAFMSINVSDVDTKLQGALTLLQNYQTAVNNVEALKIKGADTSEIEKAKAKVDEYAAAVNGLPDTVKTSIGLTDDGGKALADVNAIKEKIPTIEIPVTLAKPDDKEIQETATVTLEAKLGDSFDSVGQYVSALNNHISTITLEVELGDSFDTAGQYVSALNSHVSTITLSLNDDEIISYVAPDKNAYVMYLPDGKEITGYTVADKEGNVIFVVDDKNVTSYIVKDKEGKAVLFVDDIAVTNYVVKDKEGNVVYSPDGTKLDGYIVPNKESNVVYLPDGTKLDGYIVPNKEGNVVYIINDDSITNYVVKDKEGKVVYSPDETNLDGYVVADKKGNVIYLVKDDDVDAFKKDDHDVDAETKYSVNDDAVDKFKSTNHDVKSDVIWGNDETNVKKHFVATGTIKWSGGSGVGPNGMGGGGIKGWADGTAHVNGTVGKAYAKGDWGTKDSGTALGGELGQELVVRDGRFFTIGDEGAEFFEYKKGDIIFNAEQTRQIFEKGKITTGARRGKALANGTAFAEGTAFAPGSSAGGIIYVNGQVTTTPSKGSGKGGSGGSDKAEKEFKETFDWIEIAIDRVERAISSLDLKASSIFKSWSSRNKNLKLEIAEIGKEISIQQRGYERYMAQANSVGLSESWARLVREGAIDISTITDEDLAEKIGEYQEWYEKALDCKDAIEELKEKQAELYKQSFDNIVTQYENILSVVEHERNMLEEYMAQSEAKGYITSTKYYEALMETEKSNIAQLEKEKAALLKSLQEGMESGLIEKESEAWYEMCSSIDEVTLAIEQGNTALIEYQNSIREIEWEVFDLLQEQISNVTKEADFLIDLLSSDKLYDDRGQLTDEGMSTMGLHGQNYNTYMYQADKYAQEMLEINKQLAKDPYNQVLVKRRQELLELQQESIIAAEDEKQAIVDMVKEGIELELDALQELIDKYTDALDSQKDLYDYQRKIKDHIEEISSLEKQMSAYSGDDSEETRSKIQQIKAELEEARENLEETEYERYINDQKQLLDELYLEYELILNQRLDNIDALIADMILEINNNAVTISETLSIKADEVGYMLSDTMKTTWDANTVTITNVLTTYGSGIQSGIANLSTTLNSGLAALGARINSMMSAVNSYASSNVGSATNSSATKSDEANAQAKPSQGANVNLPSAPSTPSGSSSSSSNSGSSSSSSSSSKKTSSSSSSNKSNSTTTNTSSTKEMLSSGSVSTSATSSGLPTPNKNPSSFQAVAKGDEGYIFEEKTDTTLKSKLATDTSIVDRMKYNDFDSSFSARSDAYNAMGFSGTYTGSSSQNIKMIAWMEDNGYRNGVYRLSKDELAWTQEGRKMEAIVRPSDGAILTPLAKNDSVLKASATSNIFNFANDPSGFIRDNLNINNSVSDVPRQQSIGGTYDNDFNIQIELPNVTNYEQFKYAMQHDKSFEQMVRAMTVDKMFGGSSLKKYKY